MFSLRPSEIRYSQDSINRVFDQRCNHPYRPIGQTLDDLCEGRCQISDIPTISVLKKNGRWYSADNRRLWVFRQLERLGKCSRISVMETYYIPDHKFTTDNEGVSVVVRGNPKGRWHQRATVTETSAPSSSSSRNSFNAARSQQFHPNLTGPASVSTCSVGDTLNIRPNQGMMTNTATYDAKRPMLVNRGQPANTSRTAEEGCPCVIL